MYQMNDLEMWHERSHDLLRDAEEARVARRLRSARPQGVSRTTYGPRFAGGLRRATALWGRTSVPFFRT
jgi:hypothetical protein